MTREMGMLTKEPIMKPRSHVSKKLGPNPGFTNARRKVMIKDIMTDVKAANTMSQYFLLIFNLTS
jgi:hypothetical protein